MAQLNQKLFNFLLIYDKILFFFFVLPYLQLLIVQTIIDDICKKI